MIRLAADRGRPATAAWDVAEVVDFANGARAVRVAWSTVWRWAARAADSDGAPASRSGWDGRERGVLRVVDANKPTSAEAIGDLTAMGITPMLRPETTPRSPPGGDRGGYRRA